MAELKDVVNFLDKELEISKIPDKCINGLQIQGKSTINNVGLAVDVSLNVIKKAVEKNCDMIIAHHALIWSPVQKLTGLLAKKIELLMKNGISVYAVHLPLDAHKKYSHSKLIVDEIGMYGVSKFGEFEGNFFGFSGNLRKKLSLEQLKEIIDKKLETNSIIHNFGKKEISSVCVVSGRGDFAVEEAKAKDIDCYICGEMKYEQLLDAKDYKMNVLLAGHYKTEKLGMIRLLQIVTKKFKTPCFFLES